MKRLELTGQTFGRLKVLGFAFSNRRTYWKCQCVCGKVIITRGDYLKNGDTTSCGCRWKEIKQEFINNSTRHGMAKRGGHTSFYCIWIGINQRCLNLNNDEYKNYGGRGISIEWVSFNEFKTDMYKLYLEHIDKYGQKNTSIERINNDGNYSKYNCKWATHKEQANNKRNNRFISYNGETYSLSKWSELLNIPSARLRGRLNLGYPFIKAITSRLHSKRWRVKRERDILTGRFLSKVWEGK